MNGVGSSIKADGTVTTEGPTGMFQTLAGPPTQVLCAPHLTAPLVTCFWFDHSGRNSHSEVGTVPINLHLVD